jgi:DNA-binding MarR family transcriptional regulator
LPLSKQRYLGQLITDVARSQRTVFDRRVRRLGFTRSQWLVLRRLGIQPGTSQSELADLLEVEKATAGRLIDRLESNGWVERRADENDRRINRIYMTKHGQSVHDTIRPIAEGMMEDELSGLTISERKQLTELMMNVKDRLQEMALENEPFESIGIEIENV